MCIGIADTAGTVARQARLIGNRDWIRAGAVEMGLDCGAALLGLPVDERIDFSGADSRLDAGAVRLSGIPGISGRERGVGENDPPAVVGARRIRAKQTPLA